MIIPSGVLVMLMVAMTLHVAVAIPRPPPRPPPISRGLASTYECLKSDCIIIIVLAIASTARYIEL